MPASILILLDTRGIQLRLPSKHVIRRLKHAASIRRANLFRQAQNAARIHVSQMEHGDKPAHHWLSIITQRMIKLSHSPQPSLSSEAGNKRLSLWSIVQFLGASSIIGIITWSLSSYISAKSNQQEQLNTFIKTISDFMILNNLDGQSAGKPQLPAVPKAARGYALNTLRAFDGIPLTNDNPKKLSLIKFLYDSELIGYCKVSIFGIKGMGQNDSQKKCQPSRIRLKDASLKGLDFSGFGPIARGINLSGADLSGATLVDADLSYADFSRSTLRSTRFQNSILNGVNFSYADLVDADLRNTDLSKTILDGSQLCGANLDGAIGLNTARFKEVTIDKKTKLSEAQRQAIYSRSTNLIRVVSGCSGLVSRSSGL